MWRLLLVGSILLVALGFGAAEVEAESGYLGPEETYDVWIGDKADEYWGKKVVAVVEPNSDLDVEVCLAWYFEEPPIEDWDENRTEAGCKDEYGSGGAEKIEIIVENLEDDSVPTYHSMAMIEFGELAVEVWRESGSGNYTLDVYTVEQEE